MNDMMFPILIAVVAIMLVWGVVNLISGVTSQRKKLQERLSGDGASSEDFDPATFTVMRRKEEIKGVSGLLARLPFMRNLSRQITQTWPTLSLARLAFLSVGLAICAGFLVWGLSGATLLGTVAAGVAAIAPLMYLKMKVGKHEKRLLEQLPEGLDFLSRVLKAGHSLSTGLQMMGEEMAEPLASVFRQCYDQHSLGQSLEEALKDAALAVDNSDFGFFVTAILIQRQTGGDLSEVLGNISGMIRQRIRLQSSVKAKTAEGRFTGYILVVFPIIMFFLCYVLSPAYANVLLHTRTGIYLLCIAGAMLIMGQIVIRKVTTIKV